MIDRRHGRLHGLEGRTGSGPDPVRDHRLDLDTRHVVALVLRHAAADDDFFADQIVGIDPQAAISAFNRVVFKTTPFPR